MNLNKIIWGQDLSTVPQKFGMIQYPVIGESLRIFEKNNRDRGTETNANYKLVMKDLITNFLPLKALQHRKRYIWRGLYKPIKKIETSSTGLKNSGVPQEVTSFWDQ